jgi:hypothetical protein
MGSWSIPPSKNGVSLPKGRDLPLSRRRLDRRRSKIEGRRQNGWIPAQRVFVSNGKDLRGERAGLDEMNCRVAWKSFGDPFAAECHDEGRARFDKLICRQDLGLRT